MRDGNSGVVVGHQLDDLVGVRGPVDIMASSRLGRGGAALRRACRVL
jgi:hypothetical protein